MNTATEPALSNKPPARTRLWLHSLRPKSLMLACAGIASGTALAAWRGAFSPGVAVLALVTAVLLQVLCNLANDYGDVSKGTDATRIGPVRAVHFGVITLAQLRRALWLCGLLIVLCGTALIAFAVRDADSITVFALLGLLSIAAALGYTLGRRPYGYHGLGDASVLIFFGWVSVGGSYALQTGHLDGWVFWPATACGLLAMAVLNANNLRDIESDPLTGKRTLAVLLGARRARRYYALLVTGALSCLAWFAYATLQHWSGWLFLLGAPLWMRLTRQVLRAPDAHAMRPLFAPTVRTVLLTCALFVAGVVMASLGH